MKKQNETEKSVAVCELGPEELDCVSGGGDWFDPQTQADALNGVFGSGTCSVETIVNQDGSTTDRCVCGQ